MVRKSAPKAPVSKTAAAKTGPASVHAKKSSAAKTAAPKAAAEPQRPARAKPAKPAVPPEAIASKTVAVKIKHKLVRDSFTMPKADFDLIAVLKERALGFRRPAKKSELLRAGLSALNGLSDDALKSALNSLEALKPGRPKTSV